MRAAAALLAAVALAGCGGASDAAPRLTVGAASSLRDALRDYARGFDGATVRTSFAGSDALAAQIRAGVRPDVFVSADAAIAERLHADGLGGTPVPVATNRLVLAVPAGSTAVRNLTDLAHPGVTIAAGARTVPIGAYTEQALARLRNGGRLLANVRTRELDAAGVIGKVAAGAVDAGFVYATDAEAAGDRVDVVELPRDIQPRIEYAAIVLGGGEPARRFVAGLPAALRRAGFGAP